MAAAALYGGAAVTIWPMAFNTQFNLNVRWRALAAVAVLLSAVACSPTWNWREVQGSEAPYSVLFPGKPSSMARPVDLNGLKVTMNMTASEANDVTFAVGSAQVPDPAQRQSALLAMQVAMVRNISGEIRRQQAVQLAGGIPAVEIEALGHGRNASEKMLLVARFASHDDRVYQAVAIGPQKKLTQDAIDTFFSSLALH
jgi:hypothetical protein